MLTFIFQQIMSHLKVNDLPLKVSDVRVGKVDKEIIAPYFIVNSEYAVIQT